MKPFAAVLTLFCLLGQSSHASELPYRWMLKNVSFWYPVFTETTILLRSANKLIALDRATGKRLWENPGTPYSSYGSSGYPELANALIGVSQSQSGPKVLVMTFTANPLDENNPQVTLQGLSAASDKPLWSQPIYTDSKYVQTTWWGNLHQQPLGVYGETIVLCTRGKDPQIFFRNTRTGEELDPHKPSDLAFLRQSAKQCGDGYRIALAFLERGLVKIDSKASQPISLVTIAPEYEGSGTPVGMADGKVVVYIDTDGGGAGQSAFPKYVLCHNTAGKVLWAYPRRPTKQDWEKTFSSRPLYSGFLFQGALLNPGAHCVLVQPYDGAVCLDLSTRRTLWKKVGRFFQTYTFGKGFVRYTQVDSNANRRSHSRPYARIAYLHGRSGRLIKTVRLPVGDVIFNRGTFPVH